MSSMMLLATAVGAFEDAKQLIAKVQNTLTRAEFAQLLELPYAAGGVYQVMYLYDRVNNSMPNTELPNREEQPQVSTPEGGTVLVPPRSGGATIPNVIRNAVLPPWASRLCHPTVQQLIAPLAASEPQAAAVLDAISAVCAGRSSPTQLMQALRSLSPTVLDQLGRVEKQHAPGVVLLQAAHRMSTRSAEDEALDEDRMSKVLDTAHAPAVLDALMRRQNVIDALPLPMIWSDLPLENAAMWLFVLELATTTDGGSAAASAIKGVDTDAPQPSWRDVGLFGSAAL